MATPAPTPEPRHEQKDMFLEMLQGPTICLIIGTPTPTSSPPIYHIPRALLSVHSSYFHTEIVRLTTDSESTTGPTNNTSTEHYTSPYTPQIHLPSVTPHIFGLFLKFIYQGGYSGRVDTPLQPPPPTQNGFTPINGPPPPSLNTSVPIPPSMQAWVLGASLTARSFQNHCITHIWSALSIGKIYSLTPSLIAWVWTHTSPDAELRRLVLDVLVVHWSAHTIVVSKGQMWTEAWNELFNTYEDLRREFIFGLQGGRKVRALQAYFIGASANPPSTASGDAPATLMKTKKEGMLTPSGTPAPGINANGKIDLDGMSLQKDVNRKMNGAEGRSSPKDDLSRKKSPFVWIQPKIKQEDSGSGREAVGLN